MISRILCPTDLSAAANNAAKYASQLGRITNASVTLFHVRPEFATHVERSLEESPLNETRSMLEAQCKELAHSFEIRTEGEVDTGIRNFNNLIAHKGEAYDLLVVGSNGADSVIQYLFGSNAFNISIKSKIPTFIIPESFDYKPVSRMIYAYDYKMHSAPPFAQLQMFQSLFGAKVTFLTIVEKYADEIEEQMDLLQAKILSRWKNPELITFDYIYHPDVVSSLNHYYQMWSDHDLMVLSARNHNFVEASFRTNVIKEISAIAAYPMLVIHS